jgi:RNase P/RNase MRP subunit p30
MAKNVDIHNYDTWRKLNFNIQHCNTFLLKRSVINMGISLRNKVPNQIKRRGNFNSFRKELKSFLLKYSFYSVDEFMSCESLSV